MELDSAHATIVRRGRVIRNLADRVCKWYSSLVHVQYSSGRDRLNIVFAGTQLKPAYLTRLCVSFTKNVHSLYLSDEKSEKERKGVTHRSPAPMVMMLKSFLLRQGLRSHLVYSICLSPE